MYWGQEGGDNKKVLSLLRNKAYSAYIFFWYILYLRYKILYLN